VSRLPKSVTVDDVNCLYESLLSVYVRTYYDFRYILWCFYRTSCHKINTDDGCIFQVTYITYMNEHIRFVPVQNGNANKLYYSIGVIKWYRELSQ
jgi:hypothetical protein